MPRPTAARMLYLVIGLVLGLVAAVAVQIYVLPGVTAAVPFLAQPPTPVVASGPVQFTGANLQRVAPLNLTLDRSGVLMRLNTLELYADGVTLSYALLSGRGSVSPPTLEPDAFRLTDDRSTSYTLSPQGTGSILSAGLTTGLVSFTPAPPAEARTLQLAVPNALAVGLRLREGQARVTPGPWEFSIPLR